MLKPKKIEKLIVKIGLILALLLILLLAACQPQVVEVEVEVEKIVEVTRIVEVEKEVEVVKEVEVEKIVEVEAEESADTVETGSSGVGATGSEEDEGSPFTPQSGKVNSEQQVAQTISWIQSSGVITDPTTVRVIASRTDDVVLVMSIAADGVEEEIIVTSQIRRFRQSDLAVDSDYADRVYIGMEPGEWELLVDGIQTLLSTNVAEGLACDFCAAGEVGESFALIIEDRVVRFQLDSGESVNAIDDFLIAMRDLMSSSKQRAEEMWNQTE